MAVLCALVWVRADGKCLEPLVVARNLVRHIFLCVSVSVWRVLFFKSHFIWLIANNRSRSGACVCVCARVLLPSLLYNWLAAEERNCSGVCMCCFQVYITTG